MEVQLPEADRTDQIGLVAVGHLSGGGLADPAHRRPQQRPVVEEQVEESVQQIRSPQPVEHGGQLGVGRGHDAVVGQPAHLGRQFGGVRVGRKTVPEQVAQLLPHDLDVVAIEQWRVQDHRRNPARMADPDPGRQVAAVGGAVDDGGRHPGVVEDRGHVVDHLLDRQRLGWQVSTGVVVARHPDPAVLDHDHVEACRGRPAPHPLVLPDRRHPRTTGDDHQRPVAAGAGANVVEIELLGARGGQRPTNGADTGHSGQLVVGASPFATQGHNPIVPPVRGLFSGDSAVNSVGRQGTKSLA